MTGLKEFTMHGISDDHCGVGEIVKDFMGYSWKIIKILEASGMEYDKKEKRIRAVFTCKVVEA